MRSDLIYLSAGTAIASIAIISYGLFRSYRSGVLILFSWWPKVIRREETPLEYWALFVFYALLVPLIISLSIHYVRSLL